MAKRNRDVPASTATKAVLEGFGSTLGSYSGELETKGDHDWIKVTLNAGSAYDFALCFTDSGALYGDAQLTLRDANGAVIMDMDDGGVGNNSYIPYAATVTGTYYLDVSEHSGTKTGSYSLVSLTDNSGTLLGNGDDIYTGNGAQVRILGGAGADRIDIGLSQDALGDQGNDIIIGNATSNNIFGGLGNDTISGGAGTDFLFGDAGNDDIDGGDDGDVLWGGNGDDKLFGGDGADVLHGGLGKDFLTGNGPSDFTGDTFEFTSVAESRRGASRDVITDFIALGVPADDTIRLSGIDARSGGGDNAFKFIGSHHFHHREGELRYHIDVAHDRTIIQGDVNGDGRADLEIELTGQWVLHKTDFDL